MSADLDLDQYEDMCTNRRQCLSCSGVGRTNFHFARPCLDCNGTGHVMFQHVPLDDLAALLSLVRSERARREAAEQGSAYWNRRFAEEHARALAAEPFMRAFEGVTAAGCDSTGSFLTDAATEGYVEPCDVIGVVLALDRLATHLRAQDELKRSHLATVAAIAESLPIDEEYEARLDRMLAKKRDEPKRSEPDACDCRVPGPGLGNHCYAATRKRELCRWNRCSCVCHVRKTNEDEPKREPGGGESCADCRGSGWVWGHEQGDHETDTRYTCRRCNGAGQEPPTTEEP